MASSLTCTEYGFMIEMPRPIRPVRAASAPASTGAERRNRSLDTHSWSNPARSAASASASSSANPRSLFTPHREPSRQHHRLGLDLDQEAVPDQALGRKPALDSPVWERFSARNH